MSRIKKSVLCSICEHAFEPKHEAQKICSNACRMRSLNDSWKERTVNCINCGDTCSAKSRSRKYCDACKVKHCVHCGTAFRVKLYEQRFCSQKCQLEELHASNAVNNPCRCEICGRSFGSRFALAGHLCSHKKEQRLKNSQPCCRRCTVQLSDANWPACYRKVKSNYICRECAAKDKMISRLRTREAHLARTAAKRKEQKLQVLNAYGGRCACCGETEPVFLTIDHINNDGSKHRREIGGGGHSMYSWIVKNKFPRGIVQVLCWNCNLGRYHGGGECPHVRMRRQPAQTKESTIGRGPVASPSRRPAASESADRPA